MCVAVFVFFAVFVRSPLYDDAVPPEVSLGYMFMWRDSTDGVRDVG